MQESEPLSNFLKLVEIESVSTWREHLRFKLLSFVATDITFQITNKDLISSPVLRQLDFMSTAFMTTLLNLFKP